MTKQLVIGLIAILILCACAIPTATRAADHNSDSDKPIRLYASEHFGPIGAIRLNVLSEPSAAINGRIARGDEQIWGGELIQSIANRSVRVTVDSIGRLVLSPGTAVRVAASRSSAGESSNEMLVATLMSGALKVELNDGAAAYVEAGFSRLTSSKGVSFSVRVEDGRALVSEASGEVRIQDQQVPQDVNIRQVDDLGRPVSSGSQFSVRARSTRQIQVQVTDKNDKPLPDLPVLFSLGNPCLGSLGVAGLALTQKTDNRGIATVPLVAGAVKCAASIVAKVQGTNASLTISAKVATTVGFWSPTNTALVAAGAASAGVVTGVVVANSGSSSKPITPVPPPGIRP
jgi:hypothetical protein